MNMAIDPKSLHISRLSLEERLELVDRLLESLEAENAAPALTEAQSAELARRLADAEAHPDDVVDWEDIKAESLARLRR
jgi:putative addiction module component (TIGR02574 family)